LLLSSISAISTFMEKIRNINSKKTTKQGELILCEAGK